MTNKQKRFCEEFLVDLNGCQAAIRSGYSPATARVIASQNLTKLNIQKRITELQANRSQRTQVAQDRVLKGLAAIGFADVRKLFTASGQLRPLAELDPETAAAIASIEQAGPITKIRFWNKLDALDSLARHLGIDRLIIEINENRCLPPEVINVIGVKPNPTQFLE